MKSERRTHLVVIIALVALNVLVKWTLWTQPPQTFPDSLGYIAPAMRLLDGLGYGSQDNGYRTPTYPLFIAAIVWPFPHAELSECREARVPACLGEAQHTPGGEVDLRAVTIVQMALGLLTILLVYGFVYQIAHNAWIAGLCALTYPIDLSTGYWEISLLTDTLTTFLLALAVYLTVLLGERGAGSPRRWWLYVALGSTLGALALCHSVYVLYAVVPAAFLWWRSRPNPPSPFSLSLRSRDLRPKGKGGISLPTNAAPLGGGLGVSPITPYPLFSSPLRSEDLRPTGRGGKREESGGTPPFHLSSQAFLDSRIGDSHHATTDDPPATPLANAGQVGGAPEPRQRNMHHPSTGEGGEEEQAGGHGQSPVILSPSEMLRVNSAKNLTSEKETLRFAQSDILLVVAIPALLVLAWSARNYWVDGYFTPSTIAGYNLTQMVGPFMEQAPAPYRDLAEIYLDYRSDRIAERGNHSGTIFLAYRDMLNVRQTAWAGLSRMLTDMSVQMIAHNPRGYLQVAWQSFQQFWKFGLGRQNSELPLSWDWVKWFLDTRVHQAWMVLFFLSPLGLLLVQLSRRVEMPRAIWIWFAIVTVLYAALFSSAFNFGDNERYRTHVARLQYSAVILVAWYAGRLFLTWRQRAGAPHANV